MGGVRLSSKAIDVLKHELQGEVVMPEASAMSRGEWREFEGGANADYTELSFG
jgi:hypothetical protein